MSESPYRLFRLMYRHRILLSAIFIVVTAFLIRLYQLGQIPSGLTWDEAAIGYNGYSILTTRRDEWLTRFPISFRSFGDYKAPFAIYLNGPFTYLLGMNAFAVRLPFALSGGLAVVGIMLLTKELWEEHPQTKLIGLVSGVILALSPWHIQFTRAGFESGLALTIVIWATYFFVTATKSENNKTVAKLVLSAFLFVLSMYTYHSTKLFVPLWVIYLALLYRKSLTTNLRAVLISGFVGIAAAVPLFYDSIYGSGLVRAEVTIFSQGNMITDTLPQVISNFIYHLRPEFLIFGEVDSFRHGTGNWGVLLYTTAFFAVIGVAWYLWSLFKRNQRQKRVFSLASFYLVWIGLGLLPAAIGVVVPHSNRSLMALPGFIGLAIVGILMLKQWLENTALNQNWLDSHGNGNLLMKSVLGIIVTIHIFLFSAYFGQYLTSYQANAAAAYNDGYVRALTLAKKYELGEENYPKVDQIIVSSQLGQPVIYTLFVKEISPLQYHQGGLIKYLFVDKVTVGDLQRENSLIIATNKDDLDLDRANHKVYGSDGEIRFGLFLTQ